jgi:hypothetical protein
MAITKFRIDQKAKRIRDFQIVHDLKICATYRNIMNGAINGRTSERDRSGLQDFVTLAITVVHQRDSFGAEAAFDYNLRTEDDFKVCRSGKFGTCKLSQRPHLFGQSGLNIEPLAQVRHPVVGRIPRRSAHERFFAHGASTKFNHPIMDVQNDASDVVTRLARCFFPRKPGESRPPEYRCFPRVRRARLSAQKFT